MLKHRFTLTLEGADFEDGEVLDKLYEAGCDDGLPLIDPNGQHQIAFTRKSRCLQAAIDSAVNDVESVNGVGVTDCSYPYRQGGGTKAKWALRLIALRASYRHMRRSALSKRVSPRIHTFDGTMGQIGESEGTRRSMSEG